MRRDQGPRFQGRLAPLPATAAQARAMELGAPRVQVRVPVSDRRAGRFSNGDLFWLQEPVEIVAAPVHAGYVTWRREADDPPRLRRTWVPVGFTHRVPGPRAAPFMPAQFSRFTLRVNARVVARLQDMSEADARLEACSGLDEFRAAWDALCDPGCAWEDNPEVAVYFVTCIRKPLADVLGFRRASSRDLLP